MPSSTTAAVVFAPELFRAPGGIARVSRHYLQAIAEATSPETLSLVVLNDDVISPAQLQSCNAQNTAAIGCNRSKWTCVKSLWRILRTGRSHVTCTHVALSAVLPVLRSVGCEFTYDVVVHGIEVWKPLPRAQIRALNGARFVLSVSDYTRRNLVSRYDDLQAKTHVLPNALDPQFEPKLLDNTNGSQNTTVLAVSRLAAHDGEKGIDHLIEAIPRVASAVPDIELRIIGDGVDRKRLEQIASELPDPTQVKFLGYVDDQQLQAELAACDLFALPSRKEGFGLVYLEAMAAGKPCIVANAGGAPEVVDPQSGVVVPYGEVGLIAEAIVAAINNAWDPTAIQARAMQFSFKNFVTRWRSLCRASP
jgi:phosphatidyl-myo-inositol dimannoside synthase